MITMRQHLLRQQKILKWTTVGFAVIAAVALSALDVAHRGSNGLYSIGSWALCAALLIGMLVLIVRTWVCPRCHHTLSTRFSPINSKQDLDRCPHCGVSFDEPMP